MARPQQSRRSSVLAMHTGRMWTHLPCIWRAPLCVNKHSMLYFSPNPPILGVYPEPTNRPCPLLIQEDPRRAYNSFYFVTSNRRSTAACAIRQFSSYEPMVALSFWSAPRLQFQANVVDAARRREIRFASI